MIEAMTLTWASPPRIHPTRASANRKMRLVRPPAFMISAARMKNGTASSSNFAMPLTTYWGIATRGTSPVATNTIRPVRIIDADTGTLSSIRTQKRTRAAIPIIAWRPPLGATRLRAGRAFVRTWFLPIGPTAVPRRAAGRAGAFGFSFRWLDCTPRQANPMAGGPGFEPGLLGPEPSVLPLNYPPAAGRGPSANACTIFRLAVGRSILQPARPGRPGLPSPGPGRSWPRRGACRTLGPPPSRLVEMSVCGELGSAFVRRVVGAPDDVAEPAHAFFFRSVMRLPGVRIGSVVL